jgi:hypothetical protein
MKTQAHCSLRATCRVAALLLAGAIGATVAGCKSLWSCVPSIEVSCEAVLHEAIRARGGPPSGFVRLVEARGTLPFRAYGGWKAAFLPQITTAGRFSPRTSPTTIFGTASRWRRTSEPPWLRAMPPRLLHCGHTPAGVAVTNLDVLLDPRWAERISCAAHRVGTDVVLDAVFADDGGRYSLRFDQRRRLTRAEGPASLPPLAAVRIDAEYGDFRVVGGRLVAGRVSYRSDGERLMEERLLSFVANPPDLGTGSFRPPGLPTRPFTVPE